MCLELSLRICVNFVTFIRDSFNKSKEQQRWKNMVTILISNGEGEVSERDYL